MTSRHWLFAVPGRLLLAATIGTCTAGFAGQPPGREPVAEVFGETLSANALRATPRQQRALELKHWLESVIAEHEIKKRQLAVSGAEVEAWREQDFAVHFEGRVSDKDIKRVRARLMGIARLVALRLEDPQEAEKAFRSQLRNEHAIAQVQWDHIKATLRTRADLEAFKRRIPKGLADAKQQAYAGIGRSRALRAKLKTVIAGLGLHAPEEQELLRWYWSAFGVDTATITEIEVTDPTRIWRVKAALDSGQAFEAVLAQEKVTRTHIKTLRPSSRPWEFNDHLVRTLSLPHGASMVLKKGDRYLLTYMASKTFRKAPPFADVRPVLLNLVFRDKVEARYQRWLTAQIKQHARIQDAELAEALRHFLR